MMAEVINNNILIIQQNIELETNLVENATRGGFKRVLFVYTGLPEVKYRDLIDLYAMIMKKSIDKLMSKESQVEYGEFYKTMSSEEE